MPHADPDVRRAYRREYARELYRADAEHRARHKAHVRESKRKRREQVNAVIDAAKASGCVRCGAEEELDFHHLRDKDFDIGGWVNLGKGVEESIRLVRAEIEKCEVLCKPCHRREHSRGRLPCGTRASYQRGCRCAPCRAAQSEYASESRRRRLVRTG